LDPVDFERRVLVVASPVHAVAAPRAWRWRSAGAAAFAALATILGKGRAKDGQRTGRMGQVRSGSRAVVA